MPARGRQQWNTVLWWCCLSCCYICYLSLICSLRCGFACRVCVVCCVRDQQKGGCCQSKIWSPEGWAPTSGHVPCTKLLPHDEGEICWNRSRLPSSPLIIGEKVDKRRSELSWPHIKMRNCPSEGLLPSRTYCRVKSMSTCHCHVHNQFCFLFCPRYPGMVNSRTKWKRKIIEYSRERLSSQKWSRLE